MSESFSPIKPERLTGWRNSLRLRGTHELNQEKTIVDEQAARLMDELSATITEQISPEEIARAIENFKKEQQKGARVLHMGENSNTLAGLERRAPIEAMIQIGLEKGLITAKEGRRLEMKISALTG